MAPAKDLTHFLSEESKRREPSPLKTAFKYFGQPDLIFLGGGLPLSDYFPFNKITVESPAPPFEKGIGYAPKEGEAITKTEVLKQKIEDFDVPLSRSLQYGHTGGQPEFLKFVKEHTELFHKPPYDDWDVLATVGNTQAWDAVLRTFCNEGDSILVEQYTFPSSMEAAKSQAVKFIPIPMDAEGILPEKLDEQLAKLEKSQLPKLLYTIPTGHNPTGSSLNKERKQAIYKLSQKYDFLIIEDEPYYFLQMETYTPDASKRDIAPKGKEEFVKALEPSFLSMDVDGRVLRLDSLSKVLAPGTRIGWIVGQPALLMKFFRLHEVSIQNPCGFSSSIVTGLLSRWGNDGYLHWLMGLRAEYTTKRDVAIDAIAASFPKEIIEYVPPVAGMFFTVFIDAARHPKFSTEFDSDPLKVENAIFESSLKKGALMIPGSWFEVSPSFPEKALTTKTDYKIFFRGTYAAVPLDQLKLGLERFGSALKQEFGL
ncbi:BA75_04174T0 [Komagataella pastoris]|uniref:aromatic-amino-acid transaminase n=1 Tax=Komagataella pastoris TaxID=4922 RepID=A0A1B2JEQ2_PICPA|nr:BA75_04174T0 [Komagataella pastoris]